MTRRLRPIYPCVKGIIPSALCQVNNHHKKSYEADPKPLPKPKKGKKK